MNLLFICTVNRMRSCTAETLYNTSPEYSVRSAGISPTAPQQVTANLLQWADRAFIVENFPGIDLENKLIVLGIPDHYYYMEPELVDLLRSKIDPLLDDLR